MLIKIFQTRFEPAACGGNPMLNAVVALLQKARDLPISEVSAGPAQTSP
jgi:hypothetical protein